MADDYTDMIDMPDRRPIPEVDATPATPTSTPYADVTQQNPIAPYMIPAASPAEFEQRKSKWLQLVDRFQTDPNLQRALGMAGAMLTQPKQPGQTTAGNIGNAYVVGTNAFELGKQAQLSQGMALRKEGREERTLQQQEATGAATREHLGAQTAATATETGIKVRTADDVVRQAALKTQDLERVTREGANNEVLGNMLRDIKILQAQAEHDLPMDERRDEALAKLQEPRAKIEQLLGQAAHTAAQADQARATARLTSATAEGVEAIPADSRAAVMHPGGASGTVQNRKMYEDLYTKIAERDPNSVELRGTKSPAEFAAHMLSSTKQQDTLATIGKLVSQGVLEEKDPLVQDMLSSLRQQSAAKQPSNAAAGAPAKPPVLKPGDIYKGYKWNGGPKNLSSSWEKAE